MKTRPRDIGTKRVQYAPRVCACGCGQRPRGWSAQYVAGHKPVRPLAERLWSRCVRTASGCLEWQGFRHPTRGYGQIGRGRTAEGLVETHRAAWEVTHGPIPEGMFVCHRCDNRACCEPTHLFLGTPADNAADMVSKGRQARGLALPQTKLTAAQVAEVQTLRGQGWLQRDIAKHFGITQGHVSELLAGKYRRAS